MFILKDYPFSILLSAFIYFVMFIYSFRIRKSPGGTFLIILMALWCLQGIFSIFELRADSLETKVFWRNMQQIPLCTSPIMLLAIIMVTVGTGRKRITRSIIGLCSVMFIYWILLFTDPQHQLIRTSVWLEPFGEFERVAMTRTYFGFMFFGLIQLISFWGFVLLLFNYKKMVGRHKTQFILLLLAMFCPFILLVLSSVFDLELNVAITIIPTAILIFSALHVYKFLQVRPLAKEKVLEHMSEGILILDEQNQIIDANPAARMLDGLSKRGNLVGQYLAELFIDKPELPALCANGKQEKMEMEIGGKHVEVRFIPIHMRDSQTGSLLIFTDITERKTYESELVRQATMDGLTDLYNRKSFFELLEEAGKQRESGQDMSTSLALIDMDHFKQINDRYGHIVGDRVLRHFAALAKDVVGNKGSVGRIGGEEFAVWFPAMDEESAYLIAEEMRKRVLRERLSLEEFGRPEEISFTISIGVAELQDSHATIEAWYQLADSCLYASKKNGRNQTTLAKLMSG